MNYTSAYFDEAIQILRQLNHSKVDRMLDILLEVREQGGVSSFSASGAAQVMPRMPSMIFGKLPGSNATRLRTMSPN
jgi:hypothetical protein